MKDPKREMVEKVEAWSEWQWFTVVLKTPLLSWAWTWTPRCLFLQEGSLSKKPAMGLPPCPYPDFLLVQSDLTNLTSITMQVDLKTKWEQKCFSGGAVYVSVCVSCLVVSDSLRPCGLWPTRLLRPWNSPGKSTGVGCCKNKNTRVPLGSAGGIWVLFHNIWCSSPDHSLLPIIENIPVGTYFIPERWDLCHPVVLSAKQLKVPGIGLF